MRKLVFLFLLTIIIMESIFYFNYATAESILTSRIIHAIVSNPVSIYGKTYNLQVDNNILPIYYGFNSTYATITNVTVDKENNSVKINLKNVTETDAMWIQFPKNLIVATNNNFVLSVDGNEKRYEFATTTGANIMGFMVPTNAQMIEIRGTQIIPEFPVYFTITLLISFISVVYVTRLKRKSTFKL